MFQSIEAKVNQWQWLAPILLRCGVGIVFIIFGVDKFIHPELWIAYMPAWFTALVPIDLTLHMYIQGAVESLLGFFLIIGFWSRTTAFICTLMLGAITVSLGYNEIAVRDFGLFLAAGALSLREQQKWSVDAALKNK